jgi:HEPN domain-containing protein
MNKTDLETLVDIRVSESQVLLESKNYQGAYYLAGYALECAIKACISKQVRQYDFPNKDLAQKSHQHKLTDLLGVAGLKQELKEKEQADLDFKLNWAVAKDWTVESRYECSIESSKAYDLFQAVTDENSGVLAWLKTFW